jgi:type I site-specific restriction endonuclease
MARSIIPVYCTGQKKKSPPYKAQTKLICSPAYAKIFLKIEADYTQELVIKKLIGTVRRGTYKNGVIIAHFTGTGKTHYWNVDDLK